MFRGVRMLAGMVGLVLAGPALAADAAPATPAAAPQKAVLVTGASTGIGRKITERLAKDGYFVYAGARKDSDLAELDAIENVDAVRLDVTNPAEIAAAVETITKAGRGLYGLVNNAGVGIVAPLVDTKDEDFQWVMDVNVFGPYPRHEGIRSVDRRLERPHHDHQLDLRHPVGTQTRRVQHEQARDRGLR